jgi:inner membrane transporter RhtA
MSKEFRVQTGYKAGYTQWGFMRLWERRMQRTGQQQTARLSVPPPVIVLFSIISVQIGAVLAESLFRMIGSEGTVLLRQVFAAIVLLAVWRPRLREYSRSDYFLVLLFGLTIAAMNSAFYGAIARIPLGIASTLEFVGPLGLAVVASHRRLDLLWAAFAAVGIILLAPIGNAALDPLGVGLALLAGVGWAGYILLQVRIGRAFPGGNGLALSMAVSALALLPFGIGSGGHELLNPQVLLLGVGVAALSTIIPFSLELEALRRLPAPVFGVLMSLEPAIAAIVGFVALGQITGLRALVAIALIVIASGGSSFFQKRGRGHKDDA